jgi:hypothetical protein
MYRLRFSYEALGDRAELYGPRPANIHMPTMQKGSAAHHRKYRD